MPVYYFKDKKFKTKRQRGKYIEKNISCPKVNSKGRAKSD